MIAGMTYRVALARLVFLLGAAAGIIGVVAGFADRTWQLGVGGWLLAGVVGTTGAIAILADEFIENRKG